MKTPKCTGELSNADADADAVEEPAEKFTSPLDFCIHVLKSHGLLGGERHPSAYLSKLPYPNNPCPRPCKICGDLDNPLEMLICDDCEEVLHWSCCNPKVEMPPVDAWYCPDCIRRKPTLCKQRSSNENDGKQCYQGLLPNMLKETQHYSSVVRYGKSYQAEVPDSHGPRSDDDDYFGEETSLTKLHAPNGWHCRKSTSIGNWLQCREEVTHGDKKSICGKWRRAPLSEVQTDDWDCSCAVLWDPIHADCEVPQELSTTEVKKQLEYVKMVDK